MGLMDNFIDGVSQGIANWATGQQHGARRQQSTPQRNGNSHGRIERWCAELAWSVGERDEEQILLYFNDRNGECRTVFIGNGDGSLVNFTVFSFANVPTRKLGGDVMAYLLTRNASDCVTGMWGMFFDKEKRACFSVEYTALGDGLDAVALEHICLGLVNEAVDFDDKLRSEGLL